MTILAEDLCKVFGKGVRALEGLNVNVRDGEIFGIVGPSGCGKTTFLNLVAGLERPTKGKISIKDRSIEGPGFDRGMLFQEGGLLPWRTVQKNVEFGLEMKGVSEEKRKEAAKEYIDMVGLTGFEGVYPHELSGGMMQRTALARVLSFDPEILLMDEPFASVDALTRERLQNELLRIWEKTGKTIIFVTHSIEEAVYISDRIGVMSRRPGRIKEVIEVSLPRPREGARASPEFSRLRDSIWNLLQEEVEAVEAR